MAHVRLWGIIFVFALFPISNLTISQERESNLIEVDKFS